ncbi:MAG TPA: tRNA pseudouridine(55) synthase TruB [Baekduia sp.]|uniref:tRNA pseudouridine(55) synthase TruB n=1 Tax=Baekduia sp. TaxID=2600305 RepID=UPI002D79FD07|nr:tRNA pseudouridine(55) synthase TruB [Baekduia sp.]HET6505190.1 tRNA pseudouridine(55) synthase TruB [Baekduia sp.]
MDGVILVDKPAGPSSHDVVARVRRALGRGVKVGHGGTLDPFATGLLLVLVGRATRIQRFLMELPKEYVTEAKLGWTSTTGDPEGELARTGRVPPADAVLPTGLVRQRPPAYSAIKIDGRRAYARARAGEDVVVPEREVRVDAFEQLWRDGDDRAAFRIACSSGTYIRSLIMDLGDAYCLSLRRTSIGPFSVADASAPPDREDPEPYAPQLIALGDALRSVLPTLTLDADAATRAGHGRLVPVDAPDGEHLVLDPAGDPVCVALVTFGRAKPRVGFRA